MAKRKPVKKKNRVIQKTVLDCELSYLSRTAKRTATRRGEIPLAVVASKKLSLAEDVLIEPGEQLTIKLVSKIGHQEELASWIQKEGGTITSQVEGGEVFLVDLPVTSIGKLNGIKHLQRAEASRVLLPRLDEARGAATGLDQCPAKSFVNWKWSYVWNCRLWSRLESP